MTKSSNPSRNIFSNDSTSLVTELLRRSLTFQEKANAILGTHEASGSRTIVIEGTYKKLKKLSVKQDELLRQSLRCVEHALFRAAHVLAWAGLMDLVEEKIAKDQLKKLSELRPKWKVTSVEELREVGSDYQILDAIQELGLCSKTEEKALKGLLNKRNECAHPSDYYPGLNDSLGYISEIIQRLAQFQRRW